MNSVSLSFPSLTKSCHCCNICGASLILICCRNSDRRYLLDYATFRIRRFLGTHNEETQKKKTMAHIKHSSNLFTIRWKWKDILLYFWGSQYRDTINYSTPIFVKKFNWNWFSKERIMKVCTIFSSDVDSVLHCKKQINSINVKYFVLSDRPWGYNSQTRGHAIGWL